MMATSAIQRTRIFDPFATRPRPQEEEILQPEANEAGGRLRELLAANTQGELSAADIAAGVENNLWMLSPKSFRYFLPAFLYAASESYDYLSEFAAELVGTLTEPDRKDIEEMLDRMERVPRQARFTHEMAALLRRQQLEWFDTGAPVAIFHSRCDDLTPQEAAAIRVWLDALQRAHGADFSSGVLQRATTRFWPCRKAPP